MEWKVVEFCCTICLVRQIFWEEILRTKALVNLIEQKGVEGGKIYALFWPIYIIIISEIS